MNETIELRPQSRATAKNAVLENAFASVSDLEQLHPALHLLAHPATQGCQALFTRCYEAGENAAALPDAIMQTSTPWLQSGGLLCAAAGKLNAQRQPLTHNRLCDLAGKLSTGIADPDSEARSSFYTVRSISLPVYRRLMRDAHPASVCLQQALLHLLAWRSESPWARQQAQRLLWQGGVLGEKGEFALMTLDDELRERQVEWPALWSLLAVTGFLVRFPAGPLFPDEGTESHS